MIVIISSQEPKIEGPINGRFGRSPYFIKIDTNDMKWEAFPNPAVNQSGGAGIAAAQFVIDQKAEAVISGDFGPNASRTLGAGGVHMHVFAGEISSVSQAVDLFKEGKLPVSG